mmetsp:Transcript_41832/g.129576  ORF Transcript_41832/g.129576 Transcript_41832/m.129576 type:complete len:226 (-) Transcript_41832:896-1573(-)
MRKGRPCQLELPAPGPAAREPECRGRVAPRCGPRRARHPRLVAHDAGREPAGAAAGAAGPDVALDAAEVRAPEEAAEAVVRPARAPGVLEGPERQAGCAVDAPAHELDAVAPRQGGRIRAVVDAPRVLVEEVHEVGVVVDADVERPVGEHLDLHLQPLPVHGRPLLPRPRHGRVVAGAGRQALLHDPAPGVHRHGLRPRARVHALLEAGAGPAAVVLKVRAGAKA